MRQKLKDMDVRDWTLLLTQIAVAAIVAHAMLNSDNHLLFKMVDFFIKLTGN